MHPKVQLLNVVSRATTTADSGIYTPAAIESSRKNIAKRTINE
jgi:hypothetical protein